MVGGWKLSVFNNSPELYIQVDLGMTVVTKGADKDLSISGYSIHT